MNCQSIAVKDELKDSVEKLVRLMDSVDELVRTKLKFIIEQIQLAFMHVKHRRYSLDLLSTCGLWENTSANLTSAITVETGLTDQTMRYLVARIAKLKNRERIGSLMFYEVYVAKRCEFSRSTGQIFGMEDDQPTKTLLTVKFKSVAADYEDVIGMVPLVKIDTSILYQLFMSVLKAISEIGYNVSVSLVDAHSCNVKFYQKELCGDELALYIEHPVDKNRLLFLLLGQTHVFKCIYNNFQKRIVFECPNFGDMLISANLNHLIELFNLELSKPVKMAYELNDECLNPQTIEKNKVGLVARVFSESTRKATSYYVQNGHPEWLGTLNFLIIIAKWRNLFNVKSRSKGIRKRDHDSDPITVENLGNLEFLNQFASWLNEWMASGKKWLSKQTFQSCQQTSRSFPLLAEYLLKEEDVEYVLSGYFQDDPLEKRFGTYRQLSGANYFGSVKQFLEAEKSMMVKSLVKCSEYSMQEVQEILGKDKGKISAEVELNADNLTDMMLLIKSAGMSVMDKDILYYVAGFIARSVKKTVKCISCGDMLSNNSTISM